MNNSNRKVRIRGGVRVLLDKQFCSYMLMIN